MLDGIISRGEIVTLIGANGAGKTTLMRVLASLDPPDRGTVHLGGINVVAHPEKIRRRLGWMPDFVGVSRDMTVDQRPEAGL